ncbi:reticulon-2a isoform 1-T1 [Odontesthes bonariensis]|uniref:reticulon-2a isoform X1 n=1 Tax=Odontesthes bonariensis TaxID=219752 RepID=UPI003F585013
MGQVLGFSHCQEYGSVASTPDSTPPCTDGGNEESEMYDLQTAREWSDDEEAGDGDPDDDEGLASSPSIWGTPRQNSFELTFSYIAIAEAEAVGASRHHRERRRGPRGSRTPLIRTDTLETLLDSPDVDWDPQAFLNQEEEEEALERREQERVEARTASPVGRRVGEQTQTITIQPSTQNLDPGSRGGDTGVQRGESTSHTVQPPSPTQTAQQQSPSQMIQAAAASPTPEPESPITRETISVKLLTSPRGPPCSSPAVIGLNSQEQRVSDHWFSALNLTEDPTVCTYIAVMDLIYWKDMERTGMVLTGLVVGLLSLFQLSVIAVVSTVSLAVMCFTISVRIYYQFLYILNWGDGKHPFKWYMDLDISFSGEQADIYMQKAIVMTLSAVDTLKRLFFVGSLFESLKFLFLMYLVTYLGELCNGLTLIIISVIAVFSVPLFYQRRQEEVDSVFAKIQANIDNVKEILRRLPQGGGPPPDPTPGGAKPKTQ